jgi:hypothetical protein
VGRGFDGEGGFTQGGLSASIVSRLGSARSGDSM